MACANNEGEGKETSDDDNINFMVLQDSMAAIGISVSEYDDKPIRAKDLWEMHPQLQMIINLGCVYVIHKDRARYGKLALNGGKLCLHQFREIIQPKRIYIVELKEVKSLIDPASRLTFLDLGTNAISFGRLYIRLAPFTAVGEQFVLLCLAEYGYTYADTRMLQVWGRRQEKEYIQGGDYEFNTGEGGGALLAGVTSSGCYNWPWVAGTVFGLLNLSSTAAQFCIITRDFPGEVLTSPAFGMVEDSIHVLEKVLRYGNHESISDVFVQNCGLVVPTSLSK